MEKTSDVCVAAIFLTSTCTLDLFCQEIPLYRGQSSLAIGQVMGDVIDSFCYQQSNVKHSDVRMQKDKVTEKIV